MPISVEKFGKQKFAEVNGKRMAYIDEGAGSAIVFQHGNPIGWERDSYGHHD